MASTGVVGRERECRRLGRMMDEVFAGHAQVALIAGDPGIGKTALLRHVIEDARTRGAMVAWGTAWDRSGAPPFWPWIPVLRDCAEVAAEHGRPLATRTGAGAAALRTLLGDDGLRGNVLSPDLEAARFSFFQAAGTVVSEAAEAQPLVIALDDLHAAGAPSLLLLLFLAGATRDHPVFLLGTHRLDEVRAEPQVEDLLDQIARHGERLELAGLDPGAVSELLRREEVTTDDAVSAAVAGATGGNPLFALELGRLRQLQERSGRSENVPGTIRNVVRRRLELLGTQAAELVRAAAVVGRDVEVDVLQRLVRDVDVSAAVEEAVAARLLERRPAGVHFVHEVLRTAIYEGIPWIDRCRVHGHVARALDGPASRTPAAIIAYHYRSAGADEDLARAVHLGREAAAAAMASLAYEDAVVELRTVVQLQERLGAADHDLCDTLLALGEAEAAALRAPESQSTFERALRLAIRGGTAEQRALATLGSDYEWVDMFADDPVRIGHLERALEELPRDDTVLRARVLARLALELRLHDRDTSQKLSVEALDMARRVGDVAALAIALRARGFLLCCPDETFERLDVAEELLALGRASRNPDLLIQGYSWRAVAHLELGEVAAARADFATRDRLSERLWSYFDLYARHHSAALFALLEGRFAEAEAAMDTAYELGWGQMRRVAALAGHFGQRWLLLSHTGTADELLAHAREFHALVPTLPTAALTVVLAHMRTGGMDEARPQFDQLTSGEFADIPRDGLWLMTLVAAADVVCEDGNLSLIDALHSMLEPFAGRLAVAGHAASVVTIFGPVSRALGLLSAARSRFDEAIEHLEQAERMTARIGALPYRVVVNTDLADVLLRRDAPGDRSRAAALKRLAAADAERLGMTYDLERLQRLDVEGAASFAPVPSATIAEAAMVREGDAWRISFQGRDVTVRDSAGARYLAPLLQSPGVEVHALDLAGAPTPAEQPRIRGGGLPLLDDRARSEYRRRIEELQEEVAEAEAFHDTARAEKVEMELDHLLAELAAATGLGGRPRETSSDAERARVAVTKAVRRLIQRIEKHHAPLAHYLTATVRTGRFCSFQPELGAPVVWSIRR